MAMFYVIVAQLGRCQFVSPYITDV